MVFVPHRLVNEEYFNYDGKNILNKLKEIEKKNLTCSQKHIQEYSIFNIFKLNQGNALS